MACCRLGSPRWTSRVAGLQRCRGFSTDLERYAFLRELQDTNETVFYALLTRKHRELCRSPKHRQWVPAVSISAGCSASRADCS